MLVELNIDALVGPTHHFGGVGVGNIASAAHQHQPSSPRRAALEGLGKAELVASLGVPQFVLPPLKRPLNNWLTSLGFRGNFAEQCQQARSEAPEAYSAAFSSAFMWAANAGTFSPAVDCRDQWHHLTLANLSSSWHRFPEAAARHGQLEQMLETLTTGPGCRIHPALPSIVPLRDEGAANHMRLCDASGDQGFHLFVYGNHTASQSQGNRFLARQTLEASQAICRLHQLEGLRTFFLQQHPRALDAGVFHNDVISTSHRDLLLMHELAFLDAQPQLEALADQFRLVTGQALKIIQIPDSDVSLEDAVASYLFNSQLLTLAEDPAAMALVCARQCQETPSVARWIERLVADPANPIAAVHYVSLDQSMSGGGGPACLRLRLALSPDQLARFAPNYRLTSCLAQQLRELIETNYPESLTWNQLAEPQLLQQYERCYAAFDRLFLS